MIYSHRALEKKWQKYWQEHNTFKTPKSSAKKKAYILDMFPYPSGSGLHVGHLKGYIASDVIARYKKLQGYRVLHPIGWDAFGLPAEQFAIQTKNNPATFTTQNINNFRTQLQQLGFMYDYDKEVNTTDPKFYRWTQWIFIQLYEQGLAEIKLVDVNWCEALKTVLSNEEVLVIDGVMVSERGNHPVTRKPMKQWVLKITQYANRLLKGLDDLDWPHSVKELQRNWIGESHGTLVDFKVENTNATVTVFTTRIDTIFAVSAIILAPENPLILGITGAEQIDAMQEYIKTSRRKTDLERQEFSHHKTGIFTGSYGTHPFTGERIPIWVADYVLSNYGTGAIMLVPGHSAPDYAFALTYHLPIKYIITPIDDGPMLEDGIHINSQFLDGLDITQANEKATTELLKIKAGKIHTAYRLRDWLFSRQRYWGEPFPVIFWDDNTISIDENLPVLLPETNNITPSETGESPLANIKEWTNVTRADGVKGKRDTNTMPQWAGSCWYYLAYILKQDDGNYLALNSKEGYAALKAWLPVDLYIGGQEHAVLHLLYARFWHQVLYDLKIIPSPEPFIKLVNQGMILGSDGEKMSKSKNNGVSPDDIIRTHGADALRIYEMFMGPLTSSMAWNIQGLDGARRFLDRVYRLFTQYHDWIQTNNNKNLDYIYHETVMKVTKDLDNLSFNTAIAQLMIFVNACYKEKVIYIEYLKGFTKLLSVFASHLAEELWMLLKQPNSIFNEKWPSYDAKFLKKDKIIFIVQVNGKVKSKLQLSLDLTQKEIEKIIRADNFLIKILEKYEIIDTIFVPNKIINFVTKEKNYAS